MAHPDLPRTKLLPPTIRRAVARPALCAQIATQIENHRLTLISAPAGSGKTTLLALLHAELVARPGAWLALDAEDNAPARFGWGLVGALQRLNPALGERAQVALADGVTDANLRLFIGALVNDLIEALPDPFALMLDDAHEISNPSLFAALDYLIERLPPQARLIIATRHDPAVPLAKWRARRGERVPSSCAAVFRAGVAAAAQRSAEAPACAGLAGTHPGDN